MSRKGKFIALVLPVPICLVLLALYLSVAYVPSWYQPELVTADQQLEITDELKELTRIFNNKMQRPEPFTLTLTERQANRFLAGRDLIDPRFAQAVPKEISEPAAAFRNGTIKLGALVTYNGVELLGSVTVRLSTDQTAISIDQLKAKVGAWPAPSRPIEQRILEALPNPLGPMRIRNRFKFPHSDYDLRIGRIVAENGTLAVTIIPVNPDQD